MQFFTDAALYMWTKHFAADLSHTGEAHPGETALLMKGDHCPALCFFPLDNSICFMALNQAVKDHHVVYADGKCKFLTDL